MNFNQLLKSPRSIAPMSIFGRTSKLSFRTGVVGRPKGNNLVTRKIKVMDDKINHKDYQLEERDKIIVDLNLMIGKLNKENTNQRYELFKLQK